MSFKNKSGKDPTGYLSIKYHNHDLPIRRYLIDGGGRSTQIALKKAIENLLSPQVEWAVFYENGEIVHYHHHRAKGGIKMELSKNEYSLCLTPTKIFSLWIVPTVDARRAGKTAKRINNVAAEDIELYDAEETQKIEVYHAGKLVATRQKGVYI